MSNSINRQITFTSTLLQTAQARASQLGVSFTEYIRGLVVEDTKQLVDDVPMVDPETEKQIGRSFKDYEKGNYTTLKSEKDIEKCFKRLEKSDD